jgi:hypothetical protein
MVRVTVVNPDQVEALLTRGFVGVKQFERVDAVSAAPVLRGHVLGPTRLDHATGLPSRSNQEPAALLRGRLSRMIFDRPHGILRDLDQLAASQYRSPR